MDEAAIENLYPALTQCFAIIVCGYVAGRMNLVSETEAKGINTFVGTFALPSLIFMSLAELDLSSVNWMFLLAILISKVLVFLAVIIVIFLVRRPLHFGRAGIFAIFCTQSNDFAIGYPIVEALYKNTHPDYARYLYLMAPINLAMLNPLSFILMEIDKRRNVSNNEELLINDSDSTTSTRKKCKMLITVARNIFLNPIILMTILGILGNFIFRHKVPMYLGGVLNVLGSAFSASALFLLGLRMVGKIHKLTGPSLVVPGILIMVKLIALPLVTREVINILHAGSNASETLDLSTYGFLYGTFPAAPTVFVFATQYNIDVDLIASAMVVCTFVSAPLMFVSAKMIALTNSCSDADYIKQLDAFTLDVSIIGVIACIWVTVVFILTKKINRIPHKITACLIISHFVGCSGVILWNSVHQQTGAAGVIQFALFTVGVYSSRIWTMILSVTLLFLQCRSLCYILKLQPLFYLVGWGIPIIMTALLLIFDTRQSDIPFNKINPNFVYGTAQAIIAVSLLVLCFIVTVGCLILQQRYQRRFTAYMNLANEIANDLEPDTPEAESTTITVTNNGMKPSTSNVSCQKVTCGGLPTITEGCCEDKDPSPPVDIEDLISESLEKSETIDNLVGSSSNNLCPSRYGCQGPKRQQCEGIVRQYQEQIDEDLELIEEEPESHDPQILRHVVLVILLLCSIFVGLSLSVWTLVMEQMSGIYIELSFLDATLNFGQSIVVFAIFGLDTKEVVLPIVKFWRKLWFGANTLLLPAWHELSAETKHICDQFVTHHLQSCKNAIATNRRWRIKVYKDVFSGQQFVDWLIEVGLARDRVEAVNYSRHLIEGKVLKHINGVYHFYDRNLLYTFV